MNEPGLSKPVASETCYSPARYLEQELRSYQIRKSVGKRDLALGNDPNVRHPYSNCDPRNELIFGPDRDAKGFNEHFGRENKMGTHMRKTIKAEAPTRPI
jgi:hypothetical protein